MSAITPTPTYTHTPTYTGSPVGQVMRLVLPLLTGAVVHGWVGTMMHAAAVAVCSIPLVLVAPSIPAAGVCVVHVL